MSTVSLIDVSSYLPDREVELGFYGASADDGDALRENPMFRPPSTRRHVGARQSAAEMIALACEPLRERHGSQALRDVDVLITNVLLPDVVFTGSGADVAHRIGADPDWIVDLHNTGCASFVSMLRLAEQLLQNGEARTALICNVQNSAGQVFAQDHVRTLPHASIPGDGAGVGYLAVSDASPILGTTVRNHTEFATDVSLTTQDGRKYWEAGTGEMDVSFTEAKVARIVSRGNALVPELVGELYERLGISAADVDALVTNQPNRMFLRNWREALGIPEERHFDTFDRFGNLFGAGVPITLDHAIREGGLDDGSLVVLAGFAHAGDFAAAAAVRWTAPVPVASGTPVSAGAGA